MEPYVDKASEHRARIVAANGKVMFVASQGYNDEDDLIIARELSRRTLNDEYYSDPEYRARVDRLMAQRNAKSAQFPFGSFAPSLIDAMEALSAPNRRTAAGTIGGGWSPENKLAKVLAAPNSGADLQHNRLLRK